MDNLNLFFKTFTASLGFFFEVDLLLKLIQFYLYSAQ